MEEKELQQMLKSKFKLIKDLLQLVIENADPESRISVEHARLLVGYSQRTYFKHLRLYDFVLKNAKTSEKKYIRLAFSEPQVGHRLENGMVQLDNINQIEYEEDEGINSRSAAKDEKKVRSKRPELGELDEVDEY